MSRRKRKDKEVAKLRREVEVLRAQLSAGQRISSSALELAKEPTREETEKVVTVDIRSDLRKTAILTAVCLGILFILFLTQSRWSLVL